MTPFLFNLFHKVEAEGALPNSFYKVSITLNTKNRQRNYKNWRTTANIFHEHRCKTLQQNISKLNPQCIKIIIHHDQVEFIPGMQYCFNIRTSIDFTSHIKRIKKKGHMILSIVVGKSFDKIKLPFMSKTLSKLRIEGNFLNFIMNIYKQPTANINI